MVMMPTRSPPREGPGPIARRAVLRSPIGRRMSTAGGNGGINGLPNNYDVGCGPPAWTKPLWCRKVMVGQPLTRAEWEKIYRAKQRPSSKPTEACPVALGTNCRGLLGRIGSFVQGCRVVLAARAIVHPKHLNRLATAHP